MPIIQEMDFALQKTLALYKQSILIDSQPSELVTRMRPITQAAYQSYEALQNNRIMPIFKRAYPVITTLSSILGSKARGLFLENSSAFRGSLVTMFM